MIRLKINFMYIRYIIKKQTNKNKKKYKKKGSLKYIFNVIYIINEYIKKFKL